MKKSLILNLLFLTMMTTLALTTWSCDSKKASSSNGLKVVCTTGIIADIVKHIGKNQISVHGLMGPGVDPHLYRASERDVTKLANADIIFYNGLHLEAKMGDILNQMGHVKTTVAVTDQMPKKRLRKPQAFSGNYDPHVWFEIPLWKFAVIQVRDTLVQIDPTHQEQYQKNTAEYLSDLDKLHRIIQEKIAKIPPKDRVLITAHDAFFYFGQAYGFQVHGLVGISTAAEAGTKDIQQLADLIATQKINAIFVESSVPKRNIEAVQQAVKAREWQVRMGGQLFSDALGDQGSAEETYIGMVNHNVNTIVSGLLGVPSSAKETQP